MTAEGSVNLRARWQLISQFDSGQSCIMVKQDTPTTAEELRIAICYNTINIPGPPSNRAQQVADDFAISKLSRHFSYDRDFIHCSSDFDSSTSKSVWILCDFNVHDIRPDVSTIPTQFWKVAYSGNIQA